MKTYQQFKEFLTERIQWQRSLFDHLFLDHDGLLYDDNYYYDHELDRRYNFQKEDDATFQLPLDVSFIKKLSTPVRLIAGHATGISGVQKLKALQNKKSKQISAFTVDNYGTLINGVWADAVGGILVILDGLAVIGNEYDIDSRVNKKGTRLVDISTQGSINSENHFIEYKDQDGYRAYKALLRELLRFKHGLIKKLRATYEDKRLKTKECEASGAIANCPYDIPGNVKQKYIKQYMGGTERIIKSDPAFHEAFSKLILAWPIEQSKKWNEGSSDVDYDEIVVSDFKILKIYYTEDSLSGMDEDHFKKVIAGTIPSEKIGHEDYENSPNIVKKYLKSLKK